MFMRIGFAIASATLLLVAPAQAQAPAAPAPPPALLYGAPIGLDDAKKAAAAAIAEVGKLGANPMAVAVVDPAGYLVHFERMDGTQYGSIRVAIDKARTAALYRRPSKVFEDALAGGGLGLRVLSLHGALPVEGGVPIIADGKVVGAIGASGGSAPQDGQVASTGANAVKK